MKYPIVARVVKALLETESVKATYYESDKSIVRAVRKLYGRRILKRHNIEVTITIGRPNYLEREFIKVCKKAGEPFPVKKIQLKRYSMSNE